MTRLAYLYAYRGSLDVIVGRYWSVNAIVVIQARLEHRRGEGVSAPRICIALRIRTALLL
jgi:hypothetical protein